MSATAATKQKPLKRHPSKLKKMSAYAILAIILISIMAVLFAFPLYWIITGSFKTGAAINSTTPVWWPDKWVLTNYQKLFAGKSAPLWQLAVPFGSKFSANGEPIYFSVGPTAPAAIRWMINTVFMAVSRARKSPGDRGARGTVPRAGRGPPARRCPRCGQR